VNVSFSPLETRAKFTRLNRNRDQQEDPGVPFLQMAFDGSPYPFVGRLWPTMKKVWGTEFGFSRYRKKRNMSAIFG
jgi:hypothetical protein